MLVVVYPAGSDSPFLESVLRFFTGIPHGKRRWSRGRK